MTTAKRFPANLPQGTGGSTAKRQVLMPQPHLREAAADAARLVQPQGQGLDSASVRQRMVARLRAEGLNEERVLEALAQVPRHEFVDSALAAQAYEDTALPIGHGQTISKPSVVAHMIGLLFKGRSAAAQGHLGRVLEIGTGCGYQAAVLAMLARSVVSVERVQGLHERARANLGRVRLPVTPKLIWADGRLGAHGPFDSIVAAAGGEDLPPAWLQQLAPGGRLVAPMSKGSGQVLVVVDHVVERGVSQWLRTEHEAVLFVPLKSGVL